MSTTPRAPRRMSHLRLVAQGLVEATTAPTPAEAVRRQLAIQGQQVSSVPHAIVSRAARAGRADVEEAFEAGQLVRSWPMRGTVHITTAADHHWLRVALVHRLDAWARRCEESLGIDDALLGRAAGLALAAIAAEGPLRRARLLRVWREGGLMGADADSGAGVGVGPHEATLPPYPQQAGAAQRPLGGDRRQGEPGRPPQEGVVNPQALLAAPGPGVEPVHEGHPQPVVVGRRRNVDGATHGPGAHQLPGLEGLLDVGAPGPCGPGDNGVGHGGDLLTLDGQLAAHRLCGGRRRRRLYEPLGHQAQVGHSARGAGSRRHGPPVRRAGRRGRPCRAWRRSPGPRSGSRGPRPARAPAA